MKPPNVNLNTFGVNFGEPDDEPEETHTSNCYGCGVRFVEPVNVNETDGLCCGCAREAREQQDRRAA